jgi:hypothetical protein
MYIKIRDLAVQPFPGQVLPVSTGPVAAGSGVRARISQVMTSLKYYFHVQFISVSASSYLAFRIIFTHLSVPVIPDSLGGVFASEQVHKPVNIPSNFDM